MKQQLYKHVVNQLLDHTPVNMKASNYLMDLLGLKSEAVYRRISGKMPFTAEEILLMAMDMNVSIDNIISSGKWLINEVNSDMGLIGQREHSFIFHDSIKQMATILYTPESRQILLAINCFHPILLLDFDMLFKFSYYQWLSQNKEIPLTQTFSNLSLSPGLEQLQKQIAKELRSLCPTSMILDSDLFLNLTKDIEYYCQMQKITDEEKKLLKAEMFGLVDLYENMAQTGTFGNTAISLYLSAYLPVSSNLCWIELNDVCQSVFRLTSISPIIINNFEVCSWQKKGLDFLKGQSVYITQSNEIMQMKFFDKQRQLVGGL